MEKLPPELVLEIMDRLSYKSLLNFMTIQPYFLMIPSKRYLENKMTSEEEYKTDIKIITIVDNMIRQENRPHKRHGRYLHEDLTKTDLPFKALLDIIETDILHTILNEKLKNRITYSDLSSNKIKEIKNSYKHLFHEDRSKTAIPLFNAIFLMNNVLFPLFI